MAEEKANKQAATTLRSFTPGSILHLPGEVYGKSAEGCAEDETSGCTGSAARAKPT